MDYDYNSQNNEPNGTGNGPKTSKAGKRLFISLLVAILLIAGVAVAVVFLNKDAKAEKVQTTTSSSEGKASLNISDSKTYDEKGTDGILTGVQIAEKVKPSVVGVVTYNGNTPYGEGSGIIMGEDDSKTYTYVLTCAHIVSTSGVNVKVQLEDETQYDADIIGYDTRTDVGVIRIKATGFTAAEFGDSSVLKVGEPVYAIGNPGGTAFYGSFTGGYISAIDRPTSTSDSGYTMECIQHDAAINPGNSGGALVNSYGQVIGINSSKIADEEFEGMGFAIPISVAKNIVDEIIANGYVTDRAKLGISYLAASANQTYSMIVKMNDLPKGSIIIATIDSNSAFNGTDVKAGDIITAVNGKELTDADVLLNVIEKGSVGDSIKLTVARVNDNYSVKTFDVSVKLIEDKGSVESTTKEQTDGFSNPFAQ